MIELRFGMEPSVDEHNEIVAASKLCRREFIVALTGAGISFASGLPLSNDDVQGHQLDDLFDPDVCQVNPDGYYRLYERVVSDFQSALPNAAHVSLANHRVHVITLNIDGLHSDAGTENLIELHGNLRTLRCQACEARFDSRRIVRQIPPRCPTCQQVLRPGFSLRGGEIYHFSEAMDWVGRADTLMVVGTSLRDAPSSRLPDVARRRGTPIIFVAGRADQIIPRIFEHNSLEPSR